MDQEKHQTICVPRELLDRALNGNFPDRLIAAHELSELLTQPPMPAIPASYALVPIEPTPEMMLHKSGCRHHAWNDAECPVRKTRRNIWANMLAAVQQPTTEGSTDD